MLKQYRLKRERYAVLRHDFLENGGERIAAENLRILKTLLGATVIVLAGMLIASPYIREWKNITAAFAGGLSLYVGAGIAVYLFADRLMQRRLLLRAVCGLYLFSVQMTTAYLSGAGAGQAPGVLFAPMAIALAAAFTLPPWIGMATTAAASVWLIWMSTIFKNGSAVTLDCLIAAGALVFAAPVLWHRFLTRLRDYSRIRELERLTCTDCLTGLLNRSAAENAADQYLRRFGTQEGAALMVIDLDHFKRINEQLGHPVGDEMLETFGERLTCLFRRQDIVGRVGGDEFVVVMKGVTDRELVVRRAEAICKTAGEICPADFEGELTCSIGAAFCPDHGTNYHTLFVCADAELFALKGDDSGGFRIAS